MISKNSTTYDPAEKLSNKPKQQTTFTCSFDI